MSVFGWLRRILGHGEAIAVSPKPDKYFILGIDFGTHGTKLAYRASDGEYDQIKILALPGSGRDGRAENVFPSLIGIKERCLLFGEAGKQGESIENFKMHLDGGRSEPISGLRYEDLSILFLSYVMKEAVGKIIEANPDYNCKIFLNLGAPFSRITDAGSIRAAYDRILRLIWLAYWNGVYPDQGIDIENARGLILKLETANAPDAEVWRHLVPEIQAVATSYAQNQNFPRDTYHIVLDVGGFTTDVSIFNTGDPHEPKASVFASRVIPEAIVAYDGSPDQGQFISKLRMKINAVIMIATDGANPLLPAGQFVNFCRKALWRIGGGYFRTDMTDELLRANRFLPGYQKLDRSPQFDHNEDRLLLAAKGLATYHPNLIAIVQANPLPPFIPPPNQGLPYHLQDNR